MPTIRKRGDAYQAIVVVKKGGEVIHREARTFSKESLARDWGRRLEAQIKEVGVPQRALASTTLGDLLLRHLKVLQGLRQVRRNMEHELVFLSQQFGSRPLAGLRAEHFTKFALARQAEGTGPATILHNLATVRGVLNAARPVHGLEIDGKEVADAISALSRLGVTQKGASRDRRPSAEELEQLDAEFKRIAGNPSTIIPMDRVVKLAIALPRRREELTKMLWQDYDGSVMTLRDTKNPRVARLERVPVPPAAQEIIEALPRIDARILPYEPESISASFQRACARLGIEDLHYHDLRHEGISRLFEQGYSIPEVAMVSGHLSWAMLRRYTNLRPQTVVEKMNRNARLQEAQEATT